MEDKYPRISKDQLDLWLESPVTKVYLQCLEWSVEQISEVLGEGTWVSDNNDKSMNVINRALGEKNGLLTAGKPESILRVHEMMEEECDPVD